MLNLLSLSKKEHMSLLRNRNKVSVCLQLHFSFVHLAGVVASEAPVVVTAIFIVPQY